MSTSKDILDKVLSLPVTEQAELVDRLLMSIDNVDKEIESRWAEEAESRIDAYQAGNLKSVSVEEVLAKYK